MLFSERDIDLLRLLCWCQYASFDDLKKLSNDAEVKNLIGAGMVKWHRASRALVLAKKGKELLQMLYAIGGNYEDKTKTPKSTRTMPMSNTIYELLKQQRSIQRERRKLMGAYYIESEYVCTWPNGNIITPNYLTKSFHSVISKSSLPRVRLHDLRHTVASVLIANGTDIVTVSKQLGHAQVSTTSDVYSHVIEAAKAEATECIADVLLRRRQA